MVKSTSPKPDNRKDNVEKIQYNINQTIHNMEMADDMLQKTDDPKTRKELKEKNKRREDALDGLREEIRDEAKDRRNSHRS